ncbi:MAG: transmembrane 220 family protein [Maribacter sp.]
MEHFFKFLGGVFAILFLISAVLQYNDPDPLLWMAIYGMAALVTLGFVFNKVSYTVPAFVGLLGVIGFFFIFPDKYEGFALGKGDVKNIEEAREAFGLLIIAMLMFIFALRIRFKNKSKI